MTEATPYQQFAEKMLHANSKWIPEILQSMITDRQAELLVSLPGTAGEMAEKTGREEKAVENDLLDMFRKGLTFKKTKDGVTTWRPPMHIAQFHDATIVWPEAHEAFYENWRKYMEEEWPELARMVSGLLPRPFTRVIPIDESVETANARVLAPESVREIIGNAHRLAVAKCTCRITMRKCDGPVEVCLQVNRGADYTIERGSGREVTATEALEIIDRCRESGLVHVAMNKADVGHFLCNCCGCCCQSFSLLISEGLPLCDPSRFAPVVDAQQCTGCGECESRCWFQAIGVSDDGVAVVDGETCLGCGQCAVGCPESAIAMAETRPDDFIPA